MLSEFLELSEMWARGVFRKYKTATHLLSKTHQERMYQGMLGLCRIILTPNLILLTSSPPHHKPTQLPTNPSLIDLHTLNMDPFWNMQERH